MIGYGKSHRASLYMDMVAVMESEDTVIEWVFSL